MFVTEGTKTEPHYLQGLIDELAQLLGSGVKKQLTICPEGSSTLSLLEQAEHHVQCASDTYQHVWVLYDLDDFPSDSFDNTVERCRALTERNTEQGYGPAYHAIWSNQCFELWPLLHFELLQSDIDRTAYWDKLSQQLQERKLCDAYRKNDVCMYSLLRPYLKTAIRNAKWLERQHRGQPPSAAGPCTMVYHLFDDEVFGQYIKCR